MGATWTAWHFFFLLLLRKRGPRAFEVRDEVTLSEERPRLDYLLLRRAGSTADLDVSADGSPVTLRRLWPMLPGTSVVEYKSPTHPYRSGHLDRLWAYVHHHFANQRLAPGNSPRTSDVRQSLSRDVRQSLSRDVRQSLSRDVRQSLSRERDDLAAVLIVANRTPGLDGDVASMRLSWEDCGGGYWRVHGGLFALYVVELDVAGPADGDDMLYSLGHGKPTTAAARRFWTELVGSKEAEMSMQDMEGYDELLQKFLDSLPPERRLEGMPLEEILAGLPPEKRLAGLDRDHQALALPLDVLRLLPEEYLRSLGPEVQAELRRRLAQNGH